MALLINLRYAHPALSANRYLLLYFVSRAPWWGMCVCAIVLPRLQGFSRYHREWFPIFLGSFFLEFLFFHLYLRCILTAIIRYKISENPSNFRIDRSRVLPEEDNSRIEITNGSASETDQGSVTAALSNQDDASLSINRVYCRIFFTREFLRGVRCYSFVLVAFYVTFVFLAITPLSTFPVIGESLEDGAIVLLMWYREFVENKIIIFGHLGEILEDRMNILFIEQPNALDIVEENSEESGVVINE